MVYLDYSATTPTDKRVIKAMLPYFNKYFGNPSSIHKYGQDALKAIDKAREEVAKFFNCDFREIIFTGSATEANNLAIKGIVDFIKQKEPDRKLHIITSAIEHKSILEPIKELEKQGIQVDYLKPNKDGLIEIKDIQAALKPETILVSIGYVNNEIGVIQPINEISKLILEFRKKNLEFKIWNSEFYEKTAPPFFHTDAVQALNYVDCNIKKLGVDILTFSGHKIYAPKGIGGMFIKNEIKIKPLISGGGQEFKMRSGTENVAFIVGLAEAFKILKDKNHNIEIKKIKELQNYILKELKKIQGFHLNGSLINRLPNNLNFYFDKWLNKNIVILMDQKGVAVSSGSACEARALEPSHVLLALGLKKEKALASIRISLGRFTTKKEIDKFLEIIKKI